MLKSKGVTLITPERDLAHAVLAQAIADAIGKRVGGFSPSRSEKQKARMFLRGLGYYGEWLKYWCDACGVEVSIIKGFAESIGG